jgi:hypothetical protein
LGKNFRQTPQNRVFLSYECLRHSIVTGIS